MPPEVKTAVMVIFGFFSSLFVGVLISALWARKRKEQRDSQSAKTPVWLIFGAGAILGGAALWEGVTAYLGGRIGFKALVMLAVFSFVLVGAGSSILNELLFRRRARLIEAGRLREQYPRAPWLWSGRWRGRKMEYSNRGEMILSYSFAAVTVFGTAFVFFLRREHILETPEDFRGSLWILFVLVMGGLVAIRLAVNSTIRWLKFGRATFEMNTFPGVIGGRVQGTIFTRSRHVPSDGFDLKLSCVEMDFTFKESPSEILVTVLWEGEKKVRIENLRMGPRGVFFPVSFTIPATAEETDIFSQFKRVHWVLQANGAGPDEKFLAVFKIPVYKVPEEHPGRFPCPAAAAPPAAPYP